MEVSWAHIKMLLSNGFFASITMSTTPLDEMWREQANHVLKLFRERLDSKIPLIGVGGIMSPHEAEEKLRVGADLVQLYTGFIYHGPTLVRQAIERVARL